MASAGRERRATAGRRMSSLLGQAQEEDDAFWSHETWNEEDSGNDSFRDSDEDSALRRDEFDSDFDDSEADDEADEEAAGRAEEMELEKSERSAAKQRRGGYVEVGRPSAQQQQQPQQPGGGKRGRGSGKRLMGEGFNAGIVLNAPRPASAMPTSSLPAAAATARSPDAAVAVDQPLQLSSTSAVVATATATATASASMPPNEASLFVTVPPPSPVRSNRKSGDPVIPRSSLASTRERRSTHGVRKLRETRSTPSSDKPLRGQPRAGSNGARRKRRYAQEELLLESVHETEPENLRWLLGRKRTQDQHDKEHRDAAAHLRDSQRGSRVIQRFHSRRGCLTTLTFPEMDSVPEILTRQRQPSQLREQHNHSDPSEPHDQPTSECSTGNKEQQVVCVITGKPARYKDPLTNQPYYDVAAFRELRRRQELGRPWEEDALKRPEKDDATGPDVASGDTATYSAQPSAMKVNGERKGPPSRKDTARGPATSSKKTISDPSKLFFQSPKPAPKPRETFINTQPATSAEQQEGSIPAHLAFSWEGVGGGNSAESPVSPSGRRLSRRQWKPSEKVLETIAMSPRKDGVISTPPGLWIKPQQQILIGLGGNSAYVPAIPTAPLVPNISAASGLAKNVAQLSGADRLATPASDLRHSAPPNGSNNKKSIKKQSVPAGKSNDKIPHKKSAAPVKIKVDVSKAATSNWTTEPMAETSGVDATNSFDSLPGREDLKIPSPELQRQLQRVYTIPEQNLGDGNQESETQYITQGDLIMKAIQTYVKEHDGQEEEEPPEPTPPSQNQEQPTIDNKEEQSK